MTIEIWYEGEMLQEMPEALSTIPYEEIIRKVIFKALEYESCPYEVELSVMLTDNTSIRAVNKEHREIDSATDVLSFPMVDYEVSGSFGHVEDSDEYFNPETGELMLGDIVISVEKVMEQSEQYGHSLMRELAFLTTHSMFHLFGYDHMQEEERLIMEKKQEEVLMLLQINP